MSNEFYGHAAALRKYAGIDDAKRLRGRIQHGWTLHHSMLADEITICGEPLYVWTARDLRVADAHFRDNAHLIGAPALYDRSLWQSPADAGHALAIPSHSLVHEVIEAWALYAKELACWRKAHGQGVQVLLYVRDYERADVRRLFVAQDIPQVCAGEIESTAFLRNIFAYLGGAQVVLVNCIQTACFYALALGKPVLFYGSPVAVVTGDATTQAGFAVLQDERFVRHVFPAIYAGRLDVSLGQMHLGAVFRRSVDEIARLEWL